MKFGIRERMTIDGVTILKSIKLEYTFFFDRFSSHDLNIYRASFLIAVVISLHISSLRDLLI